MDKKTRVLFLSKGSASRGLMAEGFLRALAGDLFLPSCAGTEAANASPLATEVMREAGIDISSLQPNGITALFRETFHCVISLCDEPRERYPLFPFTRKLLRWSVPDPEAAVGGLEATRESFREVRDQLRHRVEEFVDTMHPKQRRLAGARAAAD